MPKNVYSILIGINDYPPPYQLYGCASDVEKMEEYLLGIPATNNYQITPPKLFLNKDATKAAMVKALQESIANLKHEDTLLIYYSGHGTQEKSENRFKDDHNGLLQSLVCYHTQEKSEPYLLANKELRYLFNQSASNAHIVTVFDCCHSGDITRSQLSDKMMRRLSGNHLQRPYTEFIFSKEIEESEFQKKSLNEIFPDTNVVSLSACDANQSAWEDLHGGVFTKNLLTVLTSNNGVTNYNDLVKSIEVSIRQRTQEKQTPIIDVLGNREHHQLTSWLCLHGKGLKTASGFLKFNKKLGWVFSKGQLMGVKVDDNIKIRLDDLSEPQLRVEKVDLGSSIIEDPSMDGVMLDPKKAYPVIPMVSTQKPVVAINNNQLKDDQLKQLWHILMQCDYINFSENLLACDYELVVFNNLVYFAFQNKSHQPLHKPFELNSSNFKNLLAIEDFLTTNCLTLSNWFHFSQLQLNDSFVEIPLKIEIKSHNINSWLDVTNGSIFLTAEKRHPGKNVLYQTYSTRITNECKENLYVTVLALLDSLHEISAYPFEDRTILLMPNTSKQFESVLFFDHYQEIYNWESTRVRFKFIVNNHSNIATAIPEMIQSGFVEPLTHLGSKMGASSLSKFELQEKNAVYQSEVILKNPEVHNISGALAQNWEWYTNNPSVFPLLEQLYPAPQVALLKSKLVPSPNTDQQL